jgi:hypothetical protein
MNAVMDGSLLIRIFASVIVLTYVCLFGAHKRIQYVKEGTMASNPVETIQCTGLICSTGIPMD